jgi:uncharacterized hydrophobic protein (TIGR00271 family)
VTNRENIRLLSYVRAILKDRFDLISDKADDALIDTRIRADVEMRGTNLWVLIFAIFIASIGLNVNSTAVIIGAMLISPLMGPIMAIGYGAGINDFSLIRQAFFNLCFAAAAALVTSTLYFLLSPLHGAQSELLARTTPTLWDVMIALFGGLAGIVGVTRKEKSNVIPGVAIATALMPPLCTAGFGLANGSIEMFLGAFYLFLINFVFIAFSSFVIVRMFNLTEKKYVDTLIAQRAHRLIVFITLVTFLPSFYLAYNLVHDEVFKSKATRFVKEAFDHNSTNIAKIKIDPKTQEIKVFLLGEHFSEEHIQLLSSQLPRNGLANSSLHVYQNGTHKEVDVQSLKADIMTDLYQNSKNTLAAKEQLIAALEEEKRLTVQAYELFKAIPVELQTFFPAIRDVVLSQSYNPDTKESMYLLNAFSSVPFSEEERLKIELWLKVRLKHERVKVFILFKEL